MSDKEIEKHVSDGYKELYFFLKKFNTALKAEVEELKSLVLHQKGQREALEAKNRALVGGLEQIKTVLLGTHPNDLTVKLNGIAQLVKEALERNREG